jgi:TonB family protein
MKSFFAKLLFLLCLLSAEMGSAQDTTITWINAAGKYVSQGSANTYRQSWPQNSLWIVRDFYLDGQLKMTGSFTTHHCKTEQGAFKYFSKYNVKTLEVHYDNGYLTGCYSGYFDNGNLSISGRYMDSLSLKDRNELLAELPKELPYSLDSNNLKTGSWEYYHYNGKLSGREEYVNGRIIQSIYWNEDGTESGDGDVIHQPAEFPGGDRALLIYMKKRIRYPLTEEKKRISGIVLINFTIDEKGQVKDPTNFQSISAPFDAMCMQAVKTMPLWRPSRMHNRYVKTNYNIPFHFIHPSDTEEWKKMKAAEKRQYLPRQQPSISF